MLCTISLVKQTVEIQKPNWVNFVSPNKFKGDVSNLIDVTAQGNYCLVEEMLKNGVDINFSEQSKRTALHYACILKNPHDRDRIIRLLVKYGADLNCRSITREKPLNALLNSMTHDIGKHGTVKYDQDCFKEEVDLSLLNLFICGGSDLCPIKKLKKRHAEFVEKNAIPNGQRI
ncbi:GABPB [Mytilus edulis]|uniref:GABPB n=1 Tax=Mytilus edulis TaxID=6550 RepID=A0A8S3QBP7_MYTED|nr:GABPB [Mytilus edulis]